MTSQIRDRVVALVAGGTLIVAISVAVLPGVTRTDPGPRGVAPRIEV